MEDEWPQEKYTTGKHEVIPPHQPKLRFPEFRKANDWETTRLGNVGCVKMCKRILKEQTSPRGEIPFYKIGTFGGIPDAYISRDLFESYKNRFSFPRNGAVLISASGTIGRLVRYKGEPAYFQDSNIVWLDNNENFILDDFLFYLYQLIDWSPSIGAIQRLYNESILATDVMYPCLIEQQKIAKCLSSLDELIAAQTRKVDALKTHKKGLMQQLFPREGETQPRLRFPEFQNTGDWEEKRLDDLTRYENGKAHENDISENGRYIVVNSKFISTEGAVRKFSNEGFCVADKGDLLMVLSDVPNGRAIAKCYFVESDDLYTVNQRICRIHPTNVYGRFLFYVLDRNSYFLNFDDGIKQTNLRKEDVVGCPLYVPAQLEEQQLIADCLTNLHDLIAAQTQMLEGLKTHKNGLMQQLFPSLEEVES